MTGSELHERGKQIFLEACDRPAAERAAFLDAACGGDAALRREVESLLEHRDDPFDQMASSGETAAFDPDLVAGFRLLRRVGEGGMGEVFEAEQLGPIQRRVAIKLLKRGLETREVVGRFESERQALALMDHPNVARVFEAGSTADGRPYFAMELVDGVSITEYCDAHRLPLRERLELLVRVCRGVQHAHQRGVIHRDLKASNVLVTLQDGRPVPKVIDFGIAKAIGPPLTERALTTRAGLWMGTPEAMSPEQASGSLDVDTRTDVYSLGVLLYELLVGSMPFGSLELRRAGPEELRRRIQHEEPTRPSAKVRQLGPAAAEPASKRGAHPGELYGQLRGDLDWIVLEALEKDRARRYDSPAALAADVERHLANRPVEAGPPSVAYRVGKFVRRHRLGVVAGLLLAVSVTLGALGTIEGLLRARREADTARRVAETLAGVLEGLSPEAAEGYVQSPRQLLERAVREIDSELAGQPVLQARLLANLGRIHTALGSYEAAGPLLERAIATQRELLGTEHADLAGSLRYLGSLRLATANFEGAQASFEETLAIYRRLHGPGSLEVARSLVDLGIVHLRRSRYEPAAELFDEALAIRAATLGLDHPTVFDVRYFRAQVLAWTGRYEAAREEYVAVLAERLGRAPEHPSTGWCLSSLGQVEQWVGNLKASEERLREALRILEASYGSDHPSLGWTLLTFGVTLTAQERFADARRALERAARLFEAMPSGGELGSAWVRNALGYQTWMAGDLEHALPLFESAYASLERLLGPEHPSLVVPLMNLGAVLRERGELERARPLIERGYALRQRTVGTEHPEHANDLHTLAKLHHREGRVEEASRLYEQALEATERLLGPQHPWMIRALDDYADMLRSAGQDARARGLEERSAHLAAERDRPDR